jgi:hypothetical protein
MMGRRWRAKCSSVHGVYNARDDGLDRGYQKREAFATITNDCIEPVSPVHWLGRCAYLPHSTSNVWWRVRNTLPGGGNKVELERPLALRLYPRNLHSATGKGEFGFLAPFRAPRKSNSYLKLRTSREFSR